MVGAMLSFSWGLIGPSGQSSPLPHATSNPAAVHREIVLIAVEASGAIAVIVFTLAGTTVGAVTGPIEPATIHVVAKAFLTALLVFSINLLDLLELAFDSIDSIE
jgi:TRAP-type C4-dicarboxylate transport system permease large subunit